MTELETLKARLTEAEAAQHKLMIGEAAVSVSESGAGGARSVTYTQADANRLSVYIASLQQRITRLENGTSKRGPLDI